MSDETIIFENIGIQKINWKEKRRFPGYFLSWWEVLNEIQIVTISKEDVSTQKNQPQKAKSQQTENIYLNIWDVVSGKFLSVLRDELSR